MKEKNEQEKKTDYAALIGAIANTCLLYNNRSIMGQHIDFNLEQNSPSKMGEFRVRSTFHELASEVEKRYYGECHLEEVLKEYETTSAFYSENFKRSFSIDLHNPTTEGFERKKEQIFWLLDYAYGEGDKEADWQRLSVFGKKRQLCEDFYGEECLSRNISLPILLLLMLGLLPTYNATKGQAKTMLEDFRLLMAFLRSYSARQSDVLADAPIVARFEKELKDRIGELEKNGDKDANNALSRLDLIHQTEMFFTVVANFSSTENIASSNRLLDTFEVYLDGIWVKSDGDTSFWQIEQIESGYFFHRYKKCPRNGGYYLEHERYECQLIRDNIGPVAYIAHPSYFRSLVEHANGANLRLWATVEWGKDATVLYPAADGKTITSFSLTPTIYRGGWFPQRSFLRVANDADYVKSLKDLQIEEAYGSDNYRLEINLCAITYDAIYLQIPDFVSSALDEKGRFLMVPKALDAALEDVRIGDLVGLSLFADGTLYFTIPSGMVYYKVNTKEERETLGMVVCSQILSDLDEF
ncbi:MAG: hypothetical protein MJZ02_08660 [Paludibacteraceae bacterium]|nr:hypothetical protein [Paludibacteraceae bacterium]